MGATKTPTENTPKAEKGRQINKTNLNYALHHYGQALQSLERANSMMNDLGDNAGEAGDLAREIVEIGHNANGEVNRAIDRINDLEAKRRAFFGG